MRTTSSIETSRKIKISVGLIAISLILLFTYFAVVGIISPLEWIIYDVIVALIANLIFKQIDKTKK